MEYAVPWILLLALVIIKLDTVDRNTRKLQGFHRVVSYKVIRGASRKARRRR